MSDQPNLEREVAEERADLSHSFEKSAEIVYVEPSASFELPMLAGLDHGAQAPDSSGSDD
ncbi:hypothetical protein [Humibacillus xanthopallidus]|nr:hypothetical protein [Humibacillus xanthopallidus]